MPGFVPVAHDALALCANDREMFAVFDLYQRAHRAQWVTLRLSEADMVAAWGISNHRVWALLGDLNRAGLALVTKGKARSSTTIQVLCPTAEVQRSPQRYPQRSPQGMEAEQTPGMEEVEAVAAAVAAAVQNTHLTTRACETETETETEENTDTSPPAPDPAPRGRMKAGDFEAAVVRWKQYAPGGSPLLPSVGIGKHLACRLRDHGLEAWLHVVEWYATSSHPRAVYLRNEGHSIGTLVRSSKYEEYLGFAREPAAPRLIQVADEGERLWGLVMAAHRRGKLHELRRDPPDGERITAIINDTGGLDAYRFVQADKVGHLKRDFLAAARGRR